MLPERAEGDDVRSSSILTNCREFVRTCQDEATKVTHEPCTSKHNRRLLIP